MALLAKQKSRTFVGLMSGTSLDGLDIALVKISGDGTNTHIKLCQFASIPYSNDYLNIVRPLFANPKGELGLLCQANVQVAHQHASMLNNTLALWDIKPEDIDIIASHGQTIFHSPTSEMPSTLQIGDGDHIAQLTQIITLSDFRQKHIAANGEGAPLVPYADYLLFSGSAETRVLLNIGGISNFTFIPVNGEFDAVVSADSGPGNTLMDNVVKQLNLHPKGFDENGELAASGKVCDSLLQHLLTDAYFSQASPQSSVSQSTGPEYFNTQWLEHQLSTWQSASGLAALSPVDLLATLNLFTARTIALRINPLLNTTASATVYVSGGGSHNQQLLKHLNTLLPQCTIKHSDALGIPLDAKEAVLFAVLANQTLFGDYNIFANSRKIPAVSLGKISLPN